eukprot:TRINITY_DN11255_c0_g1_i1.p1 TRINITY_DN11255_c0_g1~~TRINITY_DN11255_c0_g1_i1.p1  ORF type:complete len:157 (+),score=9.40 TRINITY_DN11255_c0_g1_i1:97-567(+)
MIISVRAIVGATHERDVKDRKLIAQNHDNIYDFESYTYQKEGDDFDEPRFIQAEVLFKTNYTLGLNSSVSNPFLFENHIVLFECYGDQSSKEFFSTVEARFKQKDLLWKTFPRLFLFWNLTGIREFYFPPGLQWKIADFDHFMGCLLYTSPSPRDS